jgi:acyl-CoA thioesterase FadM
MRDTPRSAFPHFLVIPTRWMDNDVYGHVNNVVYYSYFDTAVNQFLIERGVLDIYNDPAGMSGVAAIARCRFPLPCEACSSRLLQLQLQAEAVEQGLRSRQFENGFCIGSL